MEENKNINLNFKTNADDATADVNKLAGSINGTKKATDTLAASNRALDKTFEEVYGDLKPLTTRMGEAEDRLYELALAGQQATKEYQELLKVVANYKATQIETDKVVDAAAATMGEKLGGAISIAANAFSAFQSGLSLFGDTSKATQEQLLKIQAAMNFASSITSLVDMRDQWKLVSRAITESTLLTKANAAANSIAAGTMKLFGASVDSTTVGFRALKGAIVATGIGLAVVALGELYANFDKVKSIIDLTGSAEEKAAEKTKTARQKNIDDLKQKLTIEGATMTEGERKKLEITIKYLELRNDATIKSNEDLKKSQDEFFSIGFKDEDERLKVLLERRKGWLASINSAVASSLDEEIKKLKENKKETQKIRDEARALDENLVKAEQAEKDKIGKDAADKELERIKGLVKQLQDIRKNNQRAINDIEDNSSNERLDRLENREKEAADLILSQGKNNEKVINAHNQAILAIEKKYNRLRLEDKKEIDRLENEGREDNLIDGAKFNASIIKDDLRRLDVQRQILEEEHKINIKRLEDKRDTYNKDSKEYELYQQQLLKLKLKYSQEVITNELTSGETIKNNQAMYRDWFIAQQDHFFQDRRAALDEQETTIRSTQYASQQEQIIALGENYRAKKQLDADYAAYQGEIASIYAGALGGIGDILTSGAKENKQRQKEGIIVSNAAGAAEVVINTLVGNAKLTAELGPLAPPLITANFVAMGVSLAKMAQATDQALSKIGEGGSSVKTSAAGGVASGAAPNVSFVASSNNQLAQTIASTKQGSDLIRAYVVSSDISNSQSLEANKITASSI